MATGVTVQTNVATSDATSHYVMFSGSGFVSNDTTGAVIGSQALGLQNSNGSRLVIINGSGRLRVCTPPVGAAGDQSCVSGTF
jgi:Tfp pilus assembly protein FimT